MLGPDILTEYLQWIVWVESQSPCFMIHFADTECDI